MAHKKVLVTGANGFLGRSVCEHLLLKGYDIVGAVRDSSRSVARIENVLVGEIDRATNWSEALKGCDVVVHLAARAHLVRETSNDPCRDFKEVNTLGSLNLAKQAITSGISRFVFVSSIGVNGAITKGSPFCVESAVEPHSPYAVSKLEAEVGLMQLVRNSSMELVIIRPPAIYGQNAPGNFGLIEKAVRWRVPLPFGSLNNKRSLIHLINLSDFIEVCVIHPKAANELFIVADNHDLSTAEIIRVMGTIVGVPAKIFRFPVIMIKLFFTLIGRRKAGDSLLLDLQVDS
ncbi:MAG: NAD-dependent epimerase/dehydratase family protein, partial [Porticoccaceae bacterium]|nr:NAD-dependent epimerase/dehydratase family protein [Porticoccaceae bacterium]